MRAELLIAGVAGLTAPQLLVVPEAHADQLADTSVSVSAGITSEYIFPKQGIVVDDDGPLYQEGVAFTIGRWTADVTDYQYGENASLRETDYTLSLDADCGDNIACSFSVALWDTPTENIVDYSATVSFGDPVTLGITLERQEGETYRATLVELNASTEFKPVPSWDWLSFEVAGGVSYDADSEGSQVYANFGPNVAVGNFTISAGVQGFERLSGDGDESGFTFGVNGSLSFDSF